MRKRVSKILIMFMVINLILSFSQQIKAEGNKLEVNVELGFNNNYKAGSITPITLNIKNNYKNISGEVEIKVPTGNNKYVSYIRPLSMEKDTEKVITINIPLQGDANRIKYEITINSGREELYKDNLSFSYLSSNITQFLGVLSDDYESLTYINRLPSYKGDLLVTKNIQLTEKNFPEELQVLKNFSILVINNFDTSKLNSKQYETLKQWVNDGGTLIIGTGGSQNKTLGIFKDDFIQGKVKEVRNIDTSKIYSLITKGQSNAVITVEIADIDVKDSNIVLSDNEVKLVQKLSKGIGYVGIVAFDLGQAPLNGIIDNSTFAEKLISLVNDSISIEQNMQAYRGNNYQIREALNNFYEMGFPKASNFFLILGVYIIVVAPLNYIILKKIDKREYMWISVPAIAVIFGVIVYISGIGTRVSKLTTNMISIIDLDEKGENTVSTYTGIITSRKTKLKIDVENAGSIWPIVDGFYGDLDSYSNDTLEIKINTGENKAIEYYNTSILQTKIFKMEQGKRNIGRIEANIKYEKGNLVGTVKNSTNLDLEECFILTPDAYYKIENLKIGESRAIGNSTGITNSYIHEFIDSVYGLNYRRNYSSMTDEERRIQMDKRQKSYILNNYFQYRSQRITGINVIAFSKTPFNESLTINGSKAAKNERSFIVMPLNINFEEGDSVYLPYGIVPFNVVVSGVHYDNYSNIIEGTGSAEMIYKIEPKIIPEEIDFNIISQSYGNKLYIYNSVTGAYEDFAERSLTGEDIQKYVDASNTLKLKVEMSGKGDIEVPQISVRGKVK